MSEENHLIHAYIFFGVFCCCLKIKSTVIVYILCNTCRAHAISSIKVTTYSKFTNLRL